MPTQVMLQIEVDLFVQQAHGQYFHKVPCTSTQYPHKPHVNSEKISFGLDTLITIPQ